MMVICTENDGMNVGIQGKTLFRIISFVDPFHFSYLTIDELKEMVEQLRKEGKLTDCPEDEEEMSEDVFILKL